MPHDLKVPYSLSATTLEAKLQACESFGWSRHPNPSWQLVKSCLLWPQVYKNTLCLQVPNPLSLPGSRPKLLPKLRVLLAKIYGASKAQHSELEVSAHGIVWLWFSLGNGCKWGGRKGDTRSRSTMNGFVNVSQWEHPKSLVSIPSTHTDTHTTHTYTHKQNKIKINHQKRIREWSRHSISG